MKNLFIFAFVALSFIQTAHAGFCDPGAIGYRPQADNVEDAASTFGFVSSHDICAIREKVSLSEGQYIHISGYDVKPDGSREVHYEISDFNKKTKNDCTIGMKMVPTGTPNWDSMKDVISDPKCTNGPLK
jgi:hypothetical protein